MNDVSFNFYVNNANKVVRYLHTPPAANASLLTRIKEVFFEVITFFARVINYIFSDHHWYDEAKARSIVQYFIDTPLLHGLQPTRNVVSIILDHLRRLPKDAGFWGDGLNLPALPAPAPAPAPAPRPDEPVPAPAPAPAPLIPAPAPVIPLDSNGFDLKQMNAYSFKLQPTRNITARLMFHVHADEFGKGSNLEGMSQSLFGFFANYLEDWTKEHPHPVLSSFVANLRTADTLANIDNCNKYIAATQAAIQAAFKENRSLFLMGGWKGKPSGHAIYYEVIPQKNDEATFRLYNLGAGLNYHSTGEKGLAKKYHPYIDFKGVQLCKLLNNNVLKCLFELKHHDNTFREKEFAAEDIYVGLRGILAPREVYAGNIGQQILMSAQRSGICAMKGLFAMLRVWLETADPRQGYALYKIIKFDVSLQSLHDFMDRTKTLAKIHEAEKNDSEHARQTMRLDYNVAALSSVKTANRLDKLFKRGIVPLTVITERAQAICKIRDALKLQESALDATGNAVNTPEFYFDPTFINAYVFPYATERDQEDVKEADEKAQMSATDLFRSAKCTQLRAQGVEKLLSSQVLQKAAQQAWLNKADHDLYTGLSVWISSLPIDQKYWMELDAPNAISTIVGLKEIAQLYFQTCFTVSRSEIMLTERMQHVAKIFTIQTYLVEKLSERTLEGDFNITLSRNVAFTQFSPTALNDMHLLNKKKYDSQRLHANIKSIDTIFGGALKYTLMQEQLSVIATIVSDLNNNKLQWKEEISKELYAQLSATNQTVIEQSARIHTSSYMLPWLAGWRDVHLMLSWMINMPVGYPLNLDRTAPMNFKFEVRSKDQKSEILITLNQVDLTYIRDQIVGPNKAAEVKYQLIPMHGDFANPLLCEFLHLDDKYRHTNRFERHFEKELMHEYHELARQFNVPSQEVLEFGHIFEYSALAPMEAVNYFQKNSKKLNDPEYQSILRMALFGNVPDDLITGHLSNRLKDEYAVAFSQNLTRFLNEQIAINKENKQLQTCAFLMHLQRLVKRFSPRLFPNIAATLIDLLSVPNIDLEVRSVLYAEFIALCNEDYFNQFDDEAKRIFLIGHTHILIYPIIKQYENHITNNDVLKSLCIHKTALATYLRTCDDAEFNAILQAVYPEKQNFSWRKTANSPHLNPQFVTSDGKYVYAPLKGELINTQQQMCAIPYAIRHNPDFKNLFPDALHAQRLNNTYTFVDPSGNETRVYESFNDGIIIEQKLNNEWLRFMPRSYLFKNQKYAFSRWLVEEYTHWFNKYTDANSIRKIHMRKGLGPIEYDTVYRENSSFLVRDIALKQALVYPIGFTDFETSEYIHTWGNESILKHDSIGRCSLDDVVRVELTRFNLSFSQKEKALYCDQIPGYFAVLEKRFIHALGAFRNYILLQNGEGKQKVILPMVRFMHVETQGESLQPDFERDLKLQMSGQQIAYGVYDVSPQGHLLSGIRKDNLYLALLFTLFQKYAKAADYLTRCGDKLGSYNEEEIGILKDLCDNKHVVGIVNSGNACSLRLNAGLMLLKNYFIYQVKPDPIFVNNLAVAYSKYLEHINNITLLPLSRKDEGFLLQTLGASNLFNKRLVQLGKKRLAFEDVFAGEALLPAVVVGLEKSTRIANWIDENRDQIVRSPNLYPQEMPKSIVRLDVTKYLKQLYVMAHSNTAENIQWLSCAMHFQSDPFYREVLHYLITVNSRLVDWVIMRGHHPKVKIEQVEINKKIVRYDNRSAVQNIAAENPVALPHIQIQSAKELQINRWKALSDSAFSVTPEEDKKSLADQWIDNPRVKRAEADTKDALDSTLVAAYEEIQNDFATSQTLPKANQYRLKIPLKDIKEALLTNAKIDFDRLSKLESEILAVANQLPKDISEINAEQVYRVTGKRKLLAMQDVVICFANYLKDPAAIRRWNPHLSDDAINVIFNETNVFLHLQTENQQRNRALDWIKKIENIDDIRSEVYADLIQELAQTLAAKREYIVDLYPNYLAFEYCENISLRRDQIEILHKFLTKQTEQPVFEMIMGSGKSKVLLPLLAHLWTHAGNLVALIVPNSLFASVANDTQASLKRAFNLPLRTLHFDRNTAIDTKTLTLILEDLRSYRDNGEPIIITDKSLQCLLLKCIEKLNSIMHTQPNEWPQDVTLIREILSIFADRKQFKAIIDEADTILNVLRKVCFSMGEAQRPNEHELSVLRAIYICIYSDRNLKAIASCECVPDAINNVPVMTKEVYESKYKRALAKSFLDQLKTSRFPEGYDQYISEFLKELTNTDKEMLLDYLCHDQANVERAQNYFNSLPRHMQEIFGLAGQVIAQFLKHTLTRVSKQNYGVDSASQSSIAVPFISTNVPAKGSQFANPHITMMYTMQSILKYGVSVPLLKNEVQKLQSQYNAELVSGIAPANTDAIAKFAVMKGNLNLVLNQLNNADFEMLVKHINGNKDVRYDILETIILPQMRLYPEQISCHPQNLVSFLPDVSGFTGTLWNNLHRKFKTYPAVNITSKTYKLLFDNARPIIALIEGSAKGMMESLAKQFPVYGVLIDAGGYVKQARTAEEIAKAGDICEPGHNEDFAYEMSRFHNKPVVFYNSVNEQTVVFKGKEVPLAQSVYTEEQRIVFLDHSHTTGADVKYSRNATGVVTIGRNTLERDLKQAVWRLRGLHKGQAVVFALSEEVSSLIKQTMTDPKKPIGIEEIIHFTIVNQAQQKARDNVQLFMEQLEDIPQQLLFHLMLNKQTTPRAFNHVWKELRRLWIKPGMQSAANQYHMIARYEKKAVFVDRMLQQYEDVLKVFSAQGIPVGELLKSLKQLKDTMLPILPDEILWPPAEDLSGEVEIEIEQDVQTELEAQNMQELDDRAGDLGFCKEVSLEASAKVLTDSETTQPYFPLSEALKDTQSLSWNKETQGYAVAVADAFSDLHISLNVLSWQTYVKGSLRLFSRYRPPCSAVIVLNQHVILATQNEVNYYQAQYRRNLGNSKLEVCYLSSPYRACGDQKLSMQIVKAKFLNGETQYRQEEQYLLKNWLQRNNPARMHDFFRYCVLSDRKDAATRFHKSNLQKVFQELQGNAL